MPRKSRNYYLSNFFHIMVQGDEKKFIFSKNYQKEKFIYLLKRNAFRNNVLVISYCIMDNHAHILVYSPEIERISKMMSQSNTSYGLYFSKERKTVGHVFRDRYKSEPIYDKSYLSNCIKYIHQNPVKANIVKFCNEYPYSSFNEYLSQINAFDTELKEICNFTDTDFLDIIMNWKTDINYMDDEEKESISLVFNEIKSRYNLNSLTDKEILEIYEELKRRCKSSRTQVTKLLNLKRSTISQIIAKKQS